MLLDIIKAFRYKEIHIQLYQLLKTIYSFFSSRTKRGWHISRFKIRGKITILIRFELDSNAIVIKTLFVKKVSLIQYKLHQNSTGISTQSLSTDVLLTSGLRNVSTYYVTIGTQFGFITLFYIILFFISNSNRLSSICMGQLVGLWCSLWFWKYGAYAYDLARTGWRRQKVSWPDAEKNLPSASWVLVADRQILERSVFSFVINLLQINYCFIHLVLLKLTISTNLTY